MSVLGRPHSEFTPEIFTALITWMSDGGTLRGFCRLYSLRTLTITNWLHMKPELAPLYGKARQMGYDMLAAQCIDIADTPGHHQDDVQHRKLQIETRLKLLTKWDPARYGEKLALGGASDLPPIQHSMTSEDRIKRVKAIVEAAQKRLISEAKDATFRIEVPKEEEEDDGRRNPLAE